MKIELSIRRFDEWFDAHGQRWAKWHACVSDDTTRWECGKNAEEAIEALIKSYSFLFPQGRTGVTVIYMGITNR